MNIMTCFTFNNVTYNVGDFIEVYKDNAMRDEENDINLKKITGYLEAVSSNVIEVWVTRIGGSGISFDESVHTNIPISLIKKIDYGATNKHNMTELEMRLHQRGELRYCFE